MDITQFMIGMTLAFGRVASFLFMLPFLKGKTVPAIAKIAVGVAVSLAAYQKIEVQVETLPEFIYLLLLQMLFGFALAYVVTLIFTIPQFAGGILDHDLGYSMMQVFNPSLGQQTTLLSNIFYIVFTLIFITVGGVHQLIISIIYSFKIFELGLFFGQVGFLESIMITIGYMVVTSVQLSIPLTATVFIINIIIMIMGKSAPQINIFMNMFGIKIVFGLFFLYLSAPFYGEFFTILAETTMEHFFQLVESVVEK